VARDLAIDLGTANTLVYVRGRGVQLDQPTVIALNERTGDILAMGNEAFAMIGRTPAHIVAVRPLRGGAVSDYDTTARLLRMLLRRVGASRVARPRVVVCVPSAVTPVERRAVREAAVEAGARAAYLMEEPLAAALGLGLPVHEPTGHLVVDVGGGTTEVACISLGGIVTARALRVGGFDMDAAIAQHLRREHGVVVGERSAEEVKIAVGSAAGPVGPERVEVRGRELATGLPRTIPLGAGEARQALAEPVAQIVQLVVETLSEVPPELGNDVLDKGIFLTGGGSLLRGLGVRIARETQVAVHPAELPLACVVLGAGQAVEAFGELARLFVDAPPAR
jgi:rod shape-determining protein MreB and related proteins